MKIYIKISVICFSLLALKSHASSQQFFDWDFYRGCLICLGTAQGLVDTCYRDWYGCDHVPKDMVGINSLKISRTRFSAFTGKFPLPVSICNFRAKTTITLPNGYKYTDYSSKHDGCRYGIAVRWMWGVEANYPKDSVVRGYWTDDKTDNRYRYIGKTDI